MKQCCRQQKINRNDLSYVLKARSAKLENSRKAIDKIIDSTSRSKHVLNPEKKFHFRKPSVNALQHYSDSDYSIASKSEIQKQKVPSRALPRLQVSKQQSSINIDKKLTDQLWLAQKARRFIMRLKKQKQYNVGKSLIYRKNQQQRKQKKQTMAKKAKQAKNIFFKQDRMMKIMENIVIHEERISNRLSQSISRYKRATVMRSKTQNSERSDSMTQSVQLDSLSSRPSELPAIYSLRQRLNNLTKMVQSFSP